MPKQKPLNPNLFNTIRKFARIVGLGGILAIIFINNFTGRVYDFKIIGWIFLILFLIGSVWDAIMLIKNTYLEEKNEQNKK